MFIVLICVLIFVNRVGIYTIRKDGEFKGVLFGSNHMVDISDVITEKSISYMDSIKQCYCGKKYFGVRR